MAETNGRYDLIVGIGAEKQTYPLLFGLAAAREMNRRTVEGFTANEIKVLTDLVYSGMMNYAISRDIPFPTYGEVYEIIEVFQGQEDSKEQFDALWETFNTSRFGAEWVKGVEEAKKKVMEMMPALPTGKD